MVRIRSCYYFLPVGGKDAERIVVSKYLWPVFNDHRPLDAAFFRKSDESMDGA